MPSSPDQSPPHQATGAGVRIALIDSGINPRHPYVGAVAGGVALTQREDGAVHCTDDYIDRRGHGTALAGIVRAKAPRAELYAVKIFRDPLTPHDELTTSIILLETGLRWALERKMQIMNLSLGTTNPGHRERLQSLVEQAAAQGVLLVASSSPGQTHILPAALPGVIGVAGDDACSWWEHDYIDDDPVPLRAHPRPRPIPNLPQERNFYGHSCASAHIAGALALWAQARTTLTVNEALAYLKHTRRSPRRSH